MAVVLRNHRINNRYFDFYLPDYNLIIERDGEQHYFNTFRFRSKRKKSIEESKNMHIIGIKNVKPKIGSCQNRNWKNKGTKKAQR